ncbi:MAG: RIP metalloprotease RseP [Hyphomicrobium sp.]|jgi:regulator of sigma E protease
MIAAVANFLSTGAVQIFGFLFVLSVVVFFHELGHFLVARWCGVTVSTFSIGFGREVWGFNDAHGTRWRLSAIPLGGYVKFLDDSNAASMPQQQPSSLSPEDQAGSFHSKPVWQRAAVVAAGPIANFILAAVIYSAVNAAYGVRSIPARVDVVLQGMPAALAGIKPGDVITKIDGWSIENYEDVLKLVTASSGRALDIEVSRDGKPVEFTVMPATLEQKADIGVVMKIGDLGIRRIVVPRVGEVLPDSPAAKAGFEPGDLIATIDGKSISSFEEIVEAVGPKAGQNLLIKVQRNGRQRELSVVPAAVKSAGPDGVMVERGRIGIAPERAEPQAVSIAEAIRLGVRETYSNVAQTITGLADILAQRQSADQVGGPILMAEVTAKVIDLGIEPLLRWTALFSANIGFLNLLPIPVLDGGHLVFYAIEAIRRKPLSQRVQEIGFQIGLALVMMMVVFVNLNDIVRVGRRLFGG